MRPIRFTLSLLLVLLLSAGALSGQTGQGTSYEGAPFLILPVGARSVSLGRAVTAMPGQESAFWNPAGLAEVERSKLVLLRGELAIGTSTGVSALFVRPGVGTLGVSYLLWDAGELETRGSDRTLKGTLSLRNHLTVLSASAGLPGGLDIGANLKVAQFRLSCRGICETPGTSATAYAFDAGIQLAPTTALPLRIGAMVAHLGPRFQHENAEQSDPLPTRVRVAVAYDVLRELLEIPDLEGWLTVELQDRLLSPGSVALYVGSEIAAGRTDKLSLRAGYIVRDPDQGGGASVGLGLHFDNYQLSVAKSLTLSNLTGESEPFSAVLSVGF